MVSDLIKVLLPSCYLSVARPVARLCRAAPPGVRLPWARYARQTSVIRADGCLRGLRAGRSVDDILAANPTHRTGEATSSPEVLLDELTVWGPDVHQPAGA